jgi:superfamily I DNA/RNA helicase
MGENSTIMEKMELSEFDKQVTEILGESLKIIRAPNSGLWNNLFDAILIDEGQDFDDTWWVVLQDFLKDEKEGVFYIFFDENQRLYLADNNIPIQTTQFYIDENCRNTRHIHDAMLPYAQESEESLCEGPKGRPIEIIPIRSAAGRIELEQCLHRLIREQGLTPADIIILTATGERRSQWREGEPIGEFRLTWKLEKVARNAIRVCTIYRFKGLESPVVILTELDRRSGEFGNQLIYVGLSRARNHAIVIGELPEPGAQWAMQF